MSYRRRDKSIKRKSLYLGHPHEDEIRFQAQLTHRLALPLCVGSTVTVRQNSSAMPNLNELVTQSHLPPSRVWDVKELPKRGGYDVGPIRTQHRASSQLPTPITNLRGLCSHFADVGAP